MVKEDLAKPMTTVRWTVCALIFFAMTVNYMDRQIFSQLVPYFQDDLRLSPIDLALINVSFILPYGFAMIFVGRFIDRVGVKKGLNSTYLLWNLASMAHALIGSLPGFMGVRFLLGLGESGMYPSAVKTVAEWFPVKDRALGAGWYNAGANCGAILAPLLGIVIAEKFGWRACFVIIGLIGMVWIVFWNRLYRPLHENPKVSLSEREYIESDHETVEKIDYRQLLAMRPIYALSIAKALSDAPWWFYLTWMPTFLADQFHAGPWFRGFGIPVIYIVADVGSVAGGWASSHLIRRGMAIGPARKLTMLVCALAVVPVMLVGSLVDHAPILSIPAVYWAVGIIAIAAGAHQGFSANLFTLISDTTPRGATAMAVGAINGFAMVGASAMQVFVGWSVQVTSSYTLPFIVAGSLYLVALFCLQLLMPKVEQSPTTKRANLGWVTCAGFAVLACLGLLQYQANRPPYASLTDYLHSRGPELKLTALPQLGPTARVGWMSAQWVKWGASRFELIKFDTQNHPFIESKGAKAGRYAGPSLKEVQATYSGT